MTLQVTENSYIHRHWINANGKYSQNAPCTLKL